MAPSVFQRSQAVWAGASGAARRAGTASRNRPSCRRPGRRSRAARGWPERAAPPRGSRPGRPPGCRSRRGPRPAPGRSRARGRRRAARCRAPPGPPCGRRAGAAAAPGWSPPRPARDRGPGRGGTRARPPACARGRAGSAAASAIGTALRSFSLAARWKRASADSVRPAWRRQKPARLSAGKLWGSRLTIACRAGSASLQRPSCTACGGGVEVAGRRRSWRADRAGSR